MYLWVWDIIYYIILCQGENKIILKCDIDDQNMKFVFASNDTHSLHLDTTFQQHEDIQPIRASLGRWALSNIISTTMITFR